jgi:hypothetical protein
MSYTAITSTEISVGAALKKELFQKVKDNFDNHESRIASLSLGSAPIEVFNLDIANATSAATMTGVIYHESLAAFQITTVKVQIFEKGLITSGILEIDIKKNSTPDDIGMTSILITKPKIDFALNSDYDSSLGVLDGAEQTIAAGDFLRLDITSLPTIPLGNFRVLVYGVI